ncbi:MAG: hypothetical protein JOY81_01900 [Alphaproteobacteria bacterium]|nr:hypothetical protein [Alphaproteobacteria bacterium]
MSARVLLICLEDWLSTARLPAALSRAGFDVGIVSEAGNLACHSAHLVHRFPLDVPALRHGSLATLVAAHAAFQPDLVMPGDERAARVLNFIPRARSMPGLAALHDVARRSLGRFCPGGQGGERKATLDLAERLGIAIPKHARAATHRDLAAFAGQHGWPLYLKRDHTYGGRGVRLCPDAASAARAYDDFSRGHRLNTLYGLWRRARRCYETVRHGEDPLALPIGPGAISVESAVSGTPAYYTGVALEGRVLAGFAADVLAFEPPHGPSTRVRLHHDPEMDRTATRLVEAMGFGGFFGLDFIRRPDGSLVFLEFNGRPTTVCHLGRLVSADLCSALFAAVTGRDTSREAAAGAAAAEVRVALFPQDWTRDPAVDDRDQFALDIPDDDPPLLERLCQRLPPGIDRAKIKSLVLAG